MIFFLFSLKMIQFLKKKRVAKDFLDIQSRKQKCFQKILNEHRLKNPELTIEDLESYWIEFRLISHKKEFLDRKGLTKLLALMGVGHFESLQV